MDNPWEKTEIGFEVILSPLQRCSVAGCSRSRRRKEAKKRSRSRKEAGSRKQEEAGGEKKQEAGSRKKQEEKRSRKPFPQLLRSPISSQRGGGTETGQGLQDQSVENTLWQRRRSLWCPRRERPSWCPPPPPG